MLTELNKINEVEDLKKLNKEELEKLSAEIREILLKKLSIHGGHFGPNFGMVEATIALHYVFKSPIDKIVFDVSHQSYTHKILTGRKDAFIDEDKYDDVTGYTDFEESCHDHFKIGHTSTSIALASGLAIGRDLQKEKYNVIAIIGDGSLSGKEAVSLKPGMVITIPAEVKHWHGAKKDYWFSHLAVEVPGEETSNEWCEKVTDDVYNRLGD